MKKLMIVMFIVMGLGVMSTATAGNTVVITHPKVGGVALDWCKTWAAGCGKPAADYFCKARGYGKAVSFKKEADIGYTRIMKTGQICNSPGCDSFKFIKCSKSNYKRFVRPKYQGVALDWCYTWASNCGTKSANEFCRSRGYPKGALGFKKENNVGYTKIMRTGQICNAPGCDSFRYIDCKK
jgi:hypothetical protein